ncbi:MAG: DNA gyrase subunit A [Parcubacteria group bacterium Gr01-1014_18]|nr:MAG: DNA gyrase subunit A [Parcubacteria group bacterium Greene0416_36]TSC81013.1 MAG: DNA gyrase subunit A [Parcubacteria group bacterium Gr01-1014_18]TSC98935.1 MAG: DNA gyrase subunit A [Parcubacteria group bacterium Greene1014_20]TSD06773.1 MAG: DNA gyrase subunit A [Parcubacteria group bacterium Greene0714_2]
MAAREEKTNAIGKLENVSLAKEMEVSYLDYAMSVIVLRALPDVRDGLKPVHRRILVTLKDLHLSPGGRFRKSAKICGDVSGNYHPHGEAIVYPSMVRLAQTFSYRYPLVDGQGNFGSIDGDPPAAMRYTEARMKKFAEEMLTDLEKETVPWRDNYDATRKEPVVLPATLPNLLLNGSIGIAVGMATNIPPHNLTEVCDAIIHLVDNPDCTIEDLMQFVKGPDFPTAGIIYNKKDIQNTYATGRGGIVMRGKAEIEEDSEGAFNIVVSEIPYQVNKSAWIEHLAGLVREKKIEGIRDIRDESDKDVSVRVVIELKKGAYPKKILNQLYKMTQLQETFHVNMLALVDGIQPRILNLKMMLEEYVKHRRIVIVKRTEFELKKTREREHILEGLVLALASIDKIIETIKKSRDKDEARINLIAKFKLSEKQSLAILEMRLAQLANLERVRIEQELEEKRRLIAELLSILGSEAKILGIIKSDNERLKAEYGDARRTKIMARAVDDLGIEDVTPNESVMVMITQDGYIKRLPVDTFRRQARGGKGVSGVTTKEEDIVEHLFFSKTHDDLLFFTSRGRVFQLKGYDIPAASRTAKGQAIVNFLNLAPSEKVSAVLPVTGLADFKFLVMVTESGVIKKVDIKDFDNVRSSGLIAIKLRDADKLRWVLPSSGKDDIILATQEAQSIRFSEEDIRPMGRVASGVRGIKVHEGDFVVGMSVIGEDSRRGDLLVVTEKGYGKRSELKHYKVQNRGGSGIKTAHITDKTGKLVYAQVITSKDKGHDLVIISEQGQVIRLPFDSVSILGRDTQGVRLMRFKDPADRVATTTSVAEVENIEIPAEEGGVEK